MTNPATLIVNTGGRSYVRFRKKLEALIVSFGFKRRSVCMFTIDSITSQQSSVLLNAIYQLEASFCRSARIRLLKLYSSRLISVTIMDDR